MIRVNNLKKFYDERLVIDDVSFSVKEGEIFAIVGHSGAGKSTLLRCLNGLENYQSGSLVVDGFEVNSLKSKDLREFRKEVGMIFQNFALMNRKSVFENIATPLRFWGYKKDEILKRVDELLELIGLKNRSSSFPNELSGGQKQRVAIARALALNPKIMLCDEATSALDPMTTNSILELLKKINEKYKITIILVTHQMEVVKKIANRAILLVNGKIIKDGAIEELFLKPDSKMKEFLDEEEVLPENGINIKLYFPKGSAFDTIITKMARELDIDFSIVWGKLEVLNGNVLGNLVINTNRQNSEKIINYIEQNSNLIYEIVGRNDN